MTFLTETLKKNYYATGLNNMVVISFLLHALILSIIFFSPSMPTPRWTFGPTYTVDLVSLPSTSVDSGSSSEISRGVVGMNREVRSVVMKKEVGAALSIPVREAKIFKKETGTVDRVIEGIKKKVASSPLSSSAEGSSKPEASKGVASIASQDNPELNMQMQVYYSIVWSMIKEKWALPEGILRDANLETVIEAKILKNGSVASLSFEKQSGNRYFDESAMKAIKKVEKFPALPEWIDKKYIDIGIRFHSSDLL